MSKRNKLPTLPSALLMNEPPKAERYSHQELEQFRVVILAALEDAKTDYELISAAVARHYNDPADATPTFTITDDASNILTMADITVLATQLRKKVNELNAALRRIDEKNYGTCCLTGRRIEREQLEKEPCALLAEETRRKILTLIETTS